MRNRARKAFTLLELIVVVVVLGILALIAVPTFRSVIDSSAQSVAEQSAGTIARNANAIAAFDGGATTITHLTTAQGEYTGSGVTVTVGTSTNVVHVLVASGGSTGEACVTLTGTPAIAGIVDADNITGASALEIAAPLTIDADAVCA